MDAAKHRAEEQEQQRRKQYEQRLQEEKEARQEELAIRSVTVWSAHCVAHTAHKITD